MTVILTAAAAAVVGFLAGWYSHREAQAVLDTDADEQIAYLADELAARRRSRHPAGRALEDRSGA